MEKVKRWAVTFEVFVYARTKEIATINAIVNVSKNHVSDVKEI